MGSPPPRSSSSSSSITTSYRHRSSSNHKRHLFRKLCLRFFFCVVLPFLHLSPSSVLSSTSVALVAAAAAAAAPTPTVVILVVRGVGQPPSQPVPFFEGLFSILNSEKFRSKVLGEASSNMKIESIKLAMIRSSDGGGLPLRRTFLKIVKFPHQFQ